MFVNNVENFFIDNYVEADEFLSNKLNSSATETTDNDGNHDIQDDDLWTPNKSTQNCVQVESEENESNTTSTDDSHTPIPKKRVKGSFKKRNKGFRHVTFPVKKTVIDASAVTQKRSLLQSQNNCVTDIDDCCSSLGKISCKQFSYN